MLPVIPVKVGDVELLVEAIPVAGSQPTSRLSSAADRVEDAFTRAQNTLVEITAATARTVDRLATRAVNFESLEIGFGLKFTSQGTVLLAGVSAEANLSVKVSYARDNFVRPEG
jgi:Trypsin-co-occurring domain 1